MDSAKAWLLEQFPDYEKAIQQLWGSDKGFEATSHELQTVELKVDRLNAESDPTEPIEAEMLKARRDALHRELMMLMGANMR